MKKIVLAAILLIALLGMYSCSETENQNVVIKGKINNANISFLNVAYKGFRDTIKLQEDGSFQYTTTLSEPEFMSFYLKEKSNRIFMLIDTIADVTITADAPDLNESAQVTGTDSYLILKEIGNEHMKNLMILDTVNRWFNTEVMKAKTDSKVLESIRKKAENVYNTIIQQESAYLIKAVKENIHSMVSMTALFQTFDTNTGKPLLLTVPENIKYFEMVDSSMRVNYPNAVKTQEFHNAVNTLKANLEKLEQQEKRKNTKLKIGDKAPNFTLPSFAGDNISLSNFKGRYVLLDFWAAWCKPCREENPNIVKAYEKYKDKKFDVLQVSLDKDYMTWQKAIKSDGLVWKGHCSDFLAWASPVLETYGVNAIPSNFLIDPYGVIVATNLRGSQLHMQLEQIFADKK